MKTNERLHAVTILTELLQNKSSLAQLMPTSADVSPMTKELCFGFCRHYTRLAAIADCLMDKRPKAIEVWIALLIGLYQLHYMNQPDYAVVKETVEVLEKIKKGWAKGLVNAVLRTFCRKKDELLTELNQQPAFVHGQPKWLLKRLQKDWPYHWQAIAKANDEHPPMTLRVNLQKNSREAYLKLLDEAGIGASPHAVATEGITLSTPCDVYNLPGFAEGCVSVQDGAAQLAVSLLSLQPGLRVLDACCAPGGKTCHILESQPNLAECIALDVDARRLKRVNENLNRLNLKAKLIQGDAIATDSWWDGQLFDRILLDAPCSATGVIRRHSDIKLLRTSEELKTITHIQERMLHSLWPILASDGIMVYATCSVMLAENEEQIQKFLSTHSDVECVSLNASWGHTREYGQQILPGEQGMDGFFYAVLRKKKI